MPMARIFAAADIGSNTLHLLVGATDGELVTRIDNLSEWIGLGEVVARQGFISPERVDHLLQALKECRRVATSRKAESLYVFATEAMRTARNHEAVLEKIKKGTGIEVDIISPKREAELSIAGSQLDVESGSPEIFFEVGGGSAQIALLRKGKLKEHISLPLGTGRIIARASLQNPCPKTSIATAERYIADVLKGVSLARPKKSIAVASGGVARGLWRAVHPDGEKTVFARELEYLQWSTSRLSLDRIGSRFGVKQRRAQTLLPGSMVYRALMEKFGVSEITVSEFGVREGAILEMAKVKSK
jgi:exopolyphosphatase/guanosine-5'-triphosphate,3'-diphosphate pyrophosphatase